MLASYHPGSSLGACSSPSSTQYKIRVRYVRKDAWSVLRAMGDVISNFNRWRCILATLITSWTSKVTLGDEGAGNGYSNLLDVVSVNIELVSQGGRRHVLSHT